MLEPVVHGDHRGFFYECWREERFAQAGVDARFVQENHSRSARGTLRGLHYQLERPQGKLVRCLSGEIFDVAVDLRRSSPHFGQWFGLHLSADNKLALWVPPGFGHGFCVTAEHAEVIYACTDYYHPPSDRSLRWDDPALGIDWPLAPDAALLSDKDRQAPLLADATVYD